MTTTDMKALDELRRYVQDHVVAGTEDESGPNVIDMHFFRVRIKEDFSKTWFRFLFESFLKAGVGEFGEVSIDRIKKGPSYIEWGGWIGDQGMAMQVMAAGAYAGLWDVVTPATLHILGTQADTLAGQGFVMTTGLRE